MPIQLNAATRLKAQTSLVAQVKGDLPRAVTKGWRVYSVTPGDGTVQNAEDTVNVILFKTEGTFTYNLQTWYCSKSIRCMGKICIYRFDDSETGYMLDLDIPRFGHSDYESFINSLKAAVSVDLKGAPIVTEL